MRGAGGKAYDGQGGRVRVGRDRQFVQAVCGTFGRAALQPWPPGLVGMPCGSWLCEPQVGIRDASIKIRGSRKNKFFVAQVGGARRLEA